MMTIYYWPDGAWCYSDEFKQLPEDYSDDYSTADVDEDMEYEDIDEVVNDLIYIRRYYADN